MATFEEAYAALNAAQKAAVDYIDGPLLVIAGPGTGKTQLLSARVAHILQATDTPARNILCLTFTDNGAENMRERLSSFIGKSAYDVTISTYHAFGGDLIRRYPEYFTETRLQTPVDALGQRQIIAELVEAMRYTNPLKQTQHHLNDLLSTISEVKRALLTSQDLRLIATENLLFIQRANRSLGDILDGFSRIPSLGKALPLFQKIADTLQPYAQEKPVNQQYGSVAQLAASTLQTALDEAEAETSTKPLTEWKNDWLVKDDNNRFCIAGEYESKRIQALADVLEQYQARLELHGLYDFDDMIGRVVRALEEHDDLRFTLQEQYLYLLLDEFQDTNAAQFRLVQLLTNNPVSEGRPNVMAVGDDDQAIYAFQGAQYSNMLDFYRSYRGVEVINLTENYRSHGAIITTATQVASQIQQRLYMSFDHVTKDLHQVQTTLPERATIKRDEFLSDIAQADWIAHGIKHLVDSGVAARDIAVLAPRHRQLEPLVPYLNAQGIPVRYEKREDILEASVVKQLLTMSRLVLAIHDGDETAANHLWPTVLSYEFWRLSVSSIWEMSWQVADMHRNADGDGPTKTWTRALLDDGQRFRVPALLFLTLANKVEQETCETMLDYLIGSAVVDTNEADLPRIYSPLRDYYTSETVRREEPETFYETISHLTVLRARLREHESAGDTALGLKELIDFVDMYKAADERMINTSPYNQQADAVQVMTVFKAKGLEFAHVFLPSCQDDVWGASSRGQANRLSLPANLVPIRYAGVSDDERLRLLFVAITRARYGLYLTSVTQNYTGKATKRLRYFDERENSDGTFDTMILPEPHRRVHVSDTLPPALPSLELDWQKRHLAATTEVSLRSLLETRLTNYQLSPTHLGQFLDLEYGGPQRFFFDIILRFPVAQTPDGQFGNAVHETLEWLQYITTERGNIPSTTETIAYFAARMGRKPLMPERIAIETERGESALASYLASRAHIFTPANKAEVGFKHAGVFIGKAHLNGKIDRLELDADKHTATVVDYKTGKSYARWQSDAKLYRYKRQLCCYKLLVEHSSNYQGYHVPGGRLEFVEPDNNGRINTLELAFNDDEVTRTKRLIEAMWQHVVTLNFPKTDRYGTSLNDVRRFEDDLIAQKI